MTALAALLAVACLGVCGVHLARLGLLRTDPAGELTHAAMGAGMAAMFSPLGDPLPPAAWVVVFVVCGAGSAPGLLRGPGRAAAGHHVVGSGAMLFMLLVGHDRGGGVASVTAIVLAGYFGWHVLRCADRLRALPAPPAGAVRVRGLPDARVAAAAHVVMAAAMGVMLVGMV